MDLVSDVLSQLPVKARVNCNYKICGEWRVVSPMLEGAHFHLISEGEVVITFEGEHHALEAGDMVLFPRGDRHVIGSSLNLPAIPLEELSERMNVKKAGDGRICEIFELYEDGSEVSLICGQFLFTQRSYSHLFEHLPPMIVLRHQGQGASLWLASMIKQITAEVVSSRPGALAALDPLLNMLFVQIIRDWILHAPEHEVPWMQGLQDPKLSRAVSMLHQDIARNWTVQELASIVGMSRSSFAAKFTSVMGEPPLKYLTRWRMMVAGRLLDSDRTRKISEVAFSVGYESEASFSAAFKRHFGKPPGAFRSSETHNAA